MPISGNAKPLSATWLIAAAAAYAAVELGVTLTVGGFFEWGRAEPLLFLAVRPWLLILAAALVARYRLSSRLLFYGLALFLAATCETLLFLGLGADGSWEQTLRGLAAGALLLLVADAVLQFAQRLAGRWGRPAAAVILALLMVTPFGLRSYERLILEEADPRDAAQKPELMLMTALPIIWGEGGAFDPTSKPAAAYKALQREFALRPLDTLDPKGLAAGRLLLLAQPRLLAPEELVALDAWVRGGGRALILSDPTLVWPTALPLGDTRRPPPTGLLSPLLSHWGIRLEAPIKRTLVIDDGPYGEGVRRLAMAAPGTIASNNPGCRVAPAHYLVRCTIGQGKIILLADADLLQDRLWAAPGENGDGRDRRLSDNPVILADLLDTLGDTPRKRVDGDVQWVGKQASHSRAVMLASLPLLLAWGLSLLLRLRRKTRSATSPPKLTHSMNELEQDRNFAQNKL